MERYFSKVLIDANSGTYVEDWRISSDDLRLDDHEWSIEKRRLHGGMQEGVDVVEVDNGRLSFAIVPTRGMGVWKGAFESCSLGWASPVKTPVHPSHVRLEERGVSVFSTASMNGSCDADWRAMVRQVRTLSWITWAMRRGSTSRSMAR